MEVRGGCEGEADPENYQCIKGVKMATKIALEKFFETKYPWIENYIREIKGDIGYDTFLDDLVDYID